MDFSYIYMYVKSWIYNLQNIIIFFIGSINFLELVKQSFEAAALGLNAVALT